MAEIRARDDLVLTVNRLMICAMEDIDSGRNEASPTTLDLVQRIEDCDAALRLALGTATRERDEEKGERRALAAANSTLVSQRAHWQRRAEDLMLAASKTGLSKRVVELEGQLDEARTERDAINMRCERLHGGYDHDEAAFRRGLEVKVRP